VAGCLVGFLLWPTPDTVPVPTAAPPPSSTPTPGDDLELHGMEPGEQGNINTATDLLVGLPAAFAQGRTDGVAPNAAAVDVDVHAAFPPGAKVTVDPATWRRTGIMAAVKVTVTSMTGTTRHVAILFNSDVGWKISETYAVADQ
jgi:hypothetical protein